MHKGKKNSFKLKGKNFIQGKCYSPLSPPRLSQITRTSVELNSMKGSLQQNQNEGITHC